MDGAARQVSPRYKRVRKRGTPLRTNRVRACTSVTKPFCYNASPVPDQRIDVSTEEATAELNAVLAAPAFTRSPRLSRLLTYLCTKYFAGEADQIKEYSIGVEVLDRPSSFDPANDAGARVEVHRLRRRLQQYYETDGASRKLRLVIPIGHYVPAFISNVPERDSPAPVQATPAAELPIESAFEVIPDIIAREPRPPGTDLLSPNVLIAAILVVFSAVVLATQFSKKPAKPSAIPVRQAPQSVLLTSPRQPASVGVIPGTFVRVACGYPMPYTDRYGQTWGADRYFDGGEAFDSPRQFVFRALDPKLFQRGRSGSFSYNIPVGKGVYELRLGFIETTYGPSTPAGSGEYARTFDVRANGRVLLDDFDIYSDANGTNTADTRVFKDILPAADGMVHLEFRARRGPAVVNTIELLPAQPHRLNPIRIVAQENFVTAANGIVWSPDNYVNGGQLANHSVQVTGTEDPDLYARERFGHFEYALPVDTGTYSLSLYFAEEYFGPGNPGGKGVGSRIFDVMCNGVALLRNFDVFKEAGSNHGSVVTFHGMTPNAQGKLIVSFVPVHDYASLYALEVLDESR
jgi:hypothetical protein